MSDRLSFAEFMGYSDVSELLTQDILVFLEHLAPLSDKDVTVVGKLTSGEIAQLISVSQPELKRKSISIAIEILSRLKAAGYLENQAKMQPPQELIIKPGLDTMGLSDLLKICQESPKQKLEAWRVITNHQEYINASQKTSALAWVVNGNLDIERTVTYIHLMSDPLTVKQIPMREKGEKLISLAEALAVETRSYFHPLTGKLLRGPDKYGIDWTLELSPEYHKAAIWALIDPTCHLHPGESYNNALELLQGQGVWSLVMAQYWQALDENNSSAMSVSVYGNQQTIKKERKSKSSSLETKSNHEVLQGEAYYQQFLKEQSVGNDFQTGYSKKLTGIYDHLTVSGYNFSLDRIVCLEGAAITGYNINGTVILPPGKKISDTGYNNI
ncbi:hypothetical protein, partial [Hyella patelloides]|uniref:hypothetical protein n=1 Tax=Hyella patelloides TaxID=1982969 RepID=UPI0011AA5A4E